MAVYIKSWLFWFLGTILLVILYPPALIIWLLTFPFDRRLNLLHQYSCFWASTFTWFSPFWRVSIYGREKIKKGTVYVMVSNHQSLLDILVFYRLFRHFKWVAKEELFRLPVVGWNMRANRYIALKRGKQASIMQMMKDSEKTLISGSSVMIFPEGTRSEDTNIKAFKDGAFMLAVKTRTPIIPMIIEGSGDALPKKGFLIRGHRHIRVHVLNEIPVTEYKNMDARSLSAHVRSIMVNALKSIRDEE